MNGENDHLFDEEHLDLCPECGKNPCDECESDGDLADAIVAIAQRVAGLTDRTKVTRHSLLLEKIYGQLSDLCERLDHE
jgi:hypothetical protein